VKYHYDDLAAERGGKELSSKAAVKAPRKYYKRPSPCKKRRTMDPNEEATFLSSNFVLPEKPVTISLSADFDLIDSHRHFCPYYCGFPKEDVLANNSLECRPGWNILLTKILDFLKKSSIERKISKYNKSNFRLLIDGS